MWNSGCEGGDIRNVSSSWDDEEGAGGCPGLGGEGGGGDGRDGVGGEEGAEAGEGVLEASGGDTWASEDEDVHGDEATNALSMSMSRRG